ncbi:hypothetical protein PT974_00026 [Cladobotryum mycophilum]|uniref:ABM domain-containing protein n=1 Tax=Cladobotryum mycophilum TaxID=491253 RepID=A0ABR0T0Z5_9HYPO
MATSQTEQTHGVAGTDQDFLRQVATLDADEEFCVYSRIWAFPEGADRLANMFAETTRLSAFLSGTIHYCMCRDSHDPTLFLLFERYKGRKGFDAHIEQPFVQGLLAAGLIRHVEASFAKPIQPAKPETDSGEV